MAYVGNTPTTQSFISGTDYFNGDGATVAFTLSRAVVSVNDIEAVVNNVVQQPNSAYTISGTTITFTSAPSAGTSNIYVRYLSTTTQSITPSQNTVSYSTLNSDTQSKLGISFKNKIINGAFVIDQRRAGAAYTPTGGDTYVCDRWGEYISQASKLTFQQQTASAANTGGFTYCMGVTVASAYSIGAGDYFTMFQRIEGYNTADLAWGTANAKTVTLSFLVYSSVTGTFGGSVTNASYGRSYPFTYTINAANTWETKSVTIPGDQSGTWLTTNGIGIEVGFSFGTGSTASGTAGAWTGSWKASATGATSLVGTAGASWYITGVQLEVGTQATTFDNRSIGTELALCQRYYEVSYDLGVAVGYSGANAMLRCTIGTYASNQYGSVTFKVTKRATPTMTFYSGDGTINNLSLYNASTAVNYAASLNVASTTAANYYFIGTTSYNFTQGNYVANSEL